VFIVYAALDEKSEVCDTPIKSTKIGKIVGKAFIQKQLGCQFFTMALKLALAGSIS